MNWKQFLIYLSMILLTGCPRKDWELSVVDLTDPAFPAFCFSEKPDCQGADVDFSSFIVAEVDGNGRYVANGRLIHPMWIIEPMTNSRLGQFKYGQTPGGWAEKMKAVPLEVGKIYTLNGDYFFRFVETNGSIKAEIFMHGEFLEDLYK